MMETLRRIWNDIRRGENIDLYLAIGAAFLFSILSLVGNQPLVVTVTLFALGVVMISSLRVRYLSEELSDKLMQLEVELSAQHTNTDGLLQQILKAYTQGVQYLDDSSSVVNELEDMVKGSDEFIMALGSKSSAVSYLEQISQRVRSGAIAYYRLLTGDHITHDLHIHLEGLISNQETRIAWNRSEKYGTLAVSDKQAIFVLPTPYSTKFVGLKLLGERSARLYNQYFTQVFVKSTPIKTSVALGALCETCSPDIARNEQRIEQVLREELAKG
jgi:hypothetical protein